MGVAPLSEAAGMSPPPVIVFDLGKVLLDFDYGLAARRLAAESDRSPAEVQMLIDQSPLLHQFELGQMTDQQFFDELQKRTGFRGDFSKFRPLFADIFVSIDTMVELHDKLRREHPTFILSNTNSLAVDHIQARFEFFRRFTGYIYSYEHGAMKPDARLYQIVEQQAGARGEDILFLDDRAENIEAAARRGWKTILHQAPARTIEAMRELGIVDS